MQLSKLQLDILNQPYNKIIVNAAAASGKTETMTEKVRQLLRRGVDPHNIAVITFTNMAAATLRERLGEDYKDGLTISTIHSLAAQMLLTSGYATNEAKRAMEKEEFDDLFKLVKKYSQCVRNFEWVILDEGQDTGVDAFEFIFKMINPPNFFVCGDARQSIYGFKGARPDLFIGLSCLPDVHTFSMNENYRNGRDILRFAKRVVQRIDMNDDSIAMRETDGVVVEHPYSAQYVVDVLNHYKNWGEWGVLCRTNAQIDTLAPILKRNDIPFDTFKQSNLSKEDLDKKMSENTVKLLTIHSSKGLTIPNVIVVCPVWWNKEEYNINYVAATRAKDKLFWLKEPPKPKKKKQKFNSWE